MSDQATSNAAETAPAPAFTQEDARAYNGIIARLTELQAKIDNRAAIASREIAEVRREFDGVLNANKPFLKAYALAHLPKRKVTDLETGAVTEIDAKKFHRTTDGGVYFANKRGTIRVHLDQNCFEDLIQFLQKTSADLAREQFDIAKAISQSWTWTVDDPILLAELLRKRVPPVDESSPPAVSGKIALEYLSKIEITDDDPYGYMYVGAADKWTHNKAAQKLQQAITGNLLVEDEKEDG